MHACVPACLLVCVCVGQAEGGCWAHWSAVGHRSIIINQMNEDRMSPIVTMN